jgi:hypothetical protein
VEPGERAEGRPKIAGALADPDQRRELKVARDWHLTPQQWRELPEDDRDLMLAEAELVCPSCGNLRSVCSDPTRDWYPYKAQCYATGARDLVLRRLGKKYPPPGSKEHPETAPHPLDGVSVGVLLDDPDPDETFFG